MAISPTVLTADGSDADASSYATASISPTPGTTILVGIEVARNGDVAVPTLAGCGLTWTQIDVIGSANTDPFLVAFRAWADPASVTPGALTFSGITGAGTVEGAAWCVVEVAGVNPTTNNGVVQKAVGQTAADSLTVTLAAFANAANGTVAFFGSYDNAGGALDLTAGSGFTMIGEFSQTIANRSDSIRIGFEWRTANDTSIDATVSAANDRLLGIALELDGTNVQKSDGDTATAADAEAGVALTDSDVATAADAGETMTATIAGDDAAVGVEAETAIVLTGADDTGTGGEGELLAVPVADNDTGTASDLEAAIAAALTDSEAATTTEAEAAAAQLVDTDQGTSDDLEQVTVAVTDTDAGIAVDDLADILATLTDADAAAVVTETETVTIVAPAGGDACVTLALTPTALAALQLACPTLVVIEQHDDTLSSLALACETAAGLRLVATVRVDLDLETCC